MGTRNASGTRFFALALTGGLVAAPTAACADPPNPGFASVGLLFSIPLGGAASQGGFGAEVSYAHYVRDEAEHVVGVGGFLQAQLLFGGGFRVDFGTQGNVYLAGAELGLTWLQPRHGDGGLGLHLAPFVSGGYLSFAGRFFVPFGSAGPRWGWDLPIGLKLPLAGDDDGSVTLGSDVYRSPFTSRSVSIAGRALRDDAAVAARAALVRNDGWAKRPGGEGDERLDRAARASLAAHWAESALYEHASVAAFARLTLSLLSLGAPSWLVEECQRAALDEVDHARRCFSLASRYAGESVGPGALPEATRGPGPMTLETLAVESLVDGWYNEGVAAAIAAEGARLATDPAVRETLEVIARDEARHSELGRAVVEWCLSIDREGVRPAVLRALDGMELPSAGGEATEAERGRGVVPGSRQRALAARVRRVVQRACRRPAPGRPESPRSIARAQG